MAAKPKKVAKKIAKKAASKKPSSKKVSRNARKAKPVAKSARAIAKPKRAAAAKAKAKAPAQPSYHTVTPVLNVNGASDAIDFFKLAFGAKERVRMPGPDGKVMHCELMIGDSVVMVTDAINQPATQSSLHVYVPDCDALYSQALAAGAAQKMALQDMFWGDRFGSVTDPFGNTWSIATHKEDVSPEEMSKRMEEMGPPPGAPPSSTATI